MDNKALKVFCLLVLFLLPHSNIYLFAEENVKFILNKKIDDPISSSVIKKIYLGKISKWKNYQRIKFYMLESETITETFTKQYLGKNKRQFFNYWKRQVFTGKGSIPKTLKSIDEAIKIVSDTQGAIVYIPDQKIDNEHIRVVSLSNQ